MLWLLKIVGYLQRGLLWVGKNFWKFLGAFFGGLSVIFGIAYLIQKRKTSRYASDDKFIALKQKVSNLDANNVVIGEKNKETEAEILRIEEEKIKLQKEVDEVREIYSMTDEEVLSEFQRLYQ